MSNTDWDSKTVIGNRAGGRAPTVVKDESSLSAARRAGASIDTDKRSTASNAAHKSTEFAKIAKLDRENEVAPPSTVNKEVGKVMSAARQAMEPKMSQKDLAQKTNEKPTLVAEYESGKAVPNAQILAKFERVLKVKLRGKGIGEPLEHGKKKDEKK